MHDVPASQDLLASLELSPECVADLPAKERTSLIAYLLRWEQFEAARRCLLVLLETHSHLVSVHDSLARAHLGLGEPHLALEVMQRRHALGVSNSSQALLARAHLAAGDLAAAQRIAAMLVDTHPELLLTWSLRADICCAEGDYDGAERALLKREALQPESQGTAQGQSQLWQARGDANKALLWARIAVERYERDGRAPPVGLLRLLESLYRATDQPAQAGETAARLARRREREWAELVERLAPEPVEVAQAEPPPSTPGRDLTEAGARGFADSGSITGQVSRTPAEQARLDQALQKHFPHDSFRPGQADAIAAVMRGESVLAVMPTGAGKSLCYQLAALELPATTLVISPLIALMKDQLDGLPEGVSRLATILNHTLEWSELNSRIEGAARGRYKLVYAAPERLRQRPFLHCLNRADVSLLVVDEAHCVSLWGHDFRPDYLFIAKAWEELGRPPILATTATATARVRDDISAALRPMHLVATPVHRPNLRLEARRYGNQAERERALLGLCREIEGSGIVYANSRKKCEKLAAMLRRHGVSAIHYHAGIEDRAATQDRFMSGEVRVVVATIAFGMGVDKADVRFIIHFDPPKTLENYYQEAGRAGRDGLPARCVLFYGPGSKGTLTIWSRLDAIDEGWLRQVYAAVARRLGPERQGLVALGDLERDLVEDPTRIRVAIHFLETAGLLWRGFDLPRVATLALLAQPPPAGTEGPSPEASGADGAWDPEFVRFVEAARLTPRQRISRDLVSTSRDAGMDPREIEGKLLAWNDAGLLQYRGIARDMYLGLPKAPPDSEGRVAAMITAHRASQDARIAAIMGYAQTRTCRHGFISTHFGGEAIERCDACDNCLGLSRPPAPSQKRAPARQRPRATRQAASTTRRGPVDGDVARVILQAVAELRYPLGLSGLAQALQGARTCPVTATRIPSFGALAGTTQTSIRLMAGQLVEQGFLEQYRKENYPLLRLSAKGRAWLDPARQGQGIEAPEISLPGRSRSEGQRPVHSEEPAVYDEALFERLRAWQLEVARESDVPPFFVFPQGVLRRIAAQRPRNLQELRAIKGVGPKKLEQYGGAVIAIVAGRDPPDGEDSA